MDVKFSQLYLSPTGYKIPNWWMKNFPNWMQIFKLDIRFPTVDQIPNYIYLQLDQEGKFFYCNKVPMLAPVGMSCRPYYWSYNSVELSFKLALIRMQYLSKIKDNGEVWSNSIFENCELYFRFFEIMKMLVLGILHMQILCVGPVL